MRCSGNHHAEPPKNRTGVSFGAFRTLINVGDLGQLSLEEAALGISFERRLSPSITFQVNAGGIAYGSLSGTRFEGGFLGVAASFSVLEQKRFIPFVILGAALSFSHAPLPNRMRLYAGDVRGSVTAGYTFLERFTPYAVGRLFGGPVALVDHAQHTITWGTDAYHFQLGVGLVVLLTAGFDFSFEIVPLGEQRVSAGLGYSF